MDVIGQEPLIQKHGNVVHPRAEANVELKKVTVLMMMTAFGTLSVEQEIAKIKIRCPIFHWVLTAAMTLFQVR